MEGKILFQLAVEEQVARFGPLQTATDQVRVPSSERVGVGELGERPVPQILGLEDAPAYAEQSGCERGERVTVFLDGDARRRPLKTNFLRPGADVFA